MRNMAGNYSHRRTTFSNNLRRVTDNCSHRNFTSFQAAVNNKVLLGYGGRSGEEIKRERAL